MRTLLDENTRKAFLDALEKKIGRKLLFIDMDGVICDFDKESIKRAAELEITPEEFKNRKLYRTAKHFYLDLEPIEGAIDTIKILSSQYEIRLLSAPSWGNPNSFTEKRLWVEKHLGPWAEKRMDLTFRKDLSVGHFLIDDRLKYGAGDFIGQHLMFGTDPFSTWEEIETYLLGPDFQ